MHENNLREMPGKRVRREVMGAFCYAVSICFVVVGVEKIIGYSQQQEQVNWLYGIAGILVFWGIIFIAAWVNRYHVGRIIAVVNEQGIYVGDLDIPWSDIESVTYTLLEKDTQWVNRKGRRYDTAIVIQRKTYGEPDVEIRHTSRYICKLIKEFRPEISVKTDPRVTYQVILLLTVSLLIGMLFTLRKA